MLQANLCFLTQKKKKQIYVFFNKKIKDISDMHTPYSKD